MRHTLFVGRYFVTVGCATGFGSTKIRSDQVVCIVVLPAKEQVSAR